MDHNQSQKCLSGIDWRSPAQRQQMQSVAGETEADASLEAIEARASENRQYSHCGTLGAVSRGMARGGGLRRYQCKACKKNCNAATGTAFPILIEKSPNPSSVLSCHK